MVDYAPVKAISFILVELLCQVLDSGKIKFFCQLIPIATLIRELLPAMEHVFFVINNVKHVCALVAIWHQDSTVTVEGINVLSILWIKFKRDNIALSNDKNFLDIVSPLVTDFEDLKLVYLRVSALFRLLSEVNVVLVASLHEKWGHSTCSQGLVLARKTLLDVDFFGGLDYEDSIIWSFFIEGTDPLCFLDSFKLVTNWQLKGNVCLVDRIVN